MKAERASFQPPISHDRWAALNGPGIPYRYRVANSVVSEFATGHDPVAVIRELVQNEYDAKGKRLEIAFGPRSLSVSGEGAPIDERGWKRLSVMLGTGRIPGTTEQIQRKVNGIGSKNFGLRSLFRFGNRIYIASNGKQSVMDLIEGTPKELLPDPDSLGQPGIRLEIPYRTKPQDLLPAFTLEAEQQALQSLVEELTPTLIRLAVPRAAKSLKEVAISSERCKRRIEWTQQVKTVPSSQRGISVFRRSIRVTDSASSHPHSLSEFEFQRTLSIPAVYRGHPVPGYFQAPGQRIKIAVSVPTMRGKVLLEEAGRLYYPIGISHGFTGCCISISAPFDMDQDRSEILPPALGTWNKWLLDSAVELTLALLTGDWLERFGADGYLALSHKTIPAVPYFLQQVEQRLKTDAVWPSRARQSGRSERPVFVMASTLVIPARPELDGFFGDDSYLDARLASSPATADMAKQCGAKDFTLNSLVRLRSGGATTPTTQLATRPDASEANFYYGNYPVAISGVNWQARCAKAFDCGHLSKVNEADILATPSTLTPTDTLRPLENLWLVEPELTELCPIPRDLWLHPVLATSKTFRRLIGKKRSYDPTNWLMDVARQVEHGTLSDTERLAAYRYLVSPHRTIKRDVANTLRDNPLLLDHRGAWVAPRDVMLPSIPRSNLLEPVLHFPHPDYEADARLAKAFRFRRKLNGNDIVAYARHVAEHPELAAQCEEVLSRLSPLLTKSFVDQLKSIAFLRSSRGDLDSPENLYVSNPTTRACLGGEGSYAAGRRSSLYRRLGCMEKPRAEAIVVRLRSLRQAEQRPDHLELVYSTLVEALRAERLGLTHYTDEPILWADSRFRAPSEVLLTDEFRTTFLTAVPQLGDQPNQLRAAYHALGAHVAPQPHHWRQLFSWFDSRYRASRAVLSEAERRALRNAYRKLASTQIQPGAPDQCLLDREGRLHSLEDLYAGRYLRDDDPPLARACREQGAPVAFADITGPGAEQVATYYRSIGLRNLTDVSEKLGTRVGAEIQVPPRLKLSQVLARIRTPLFTSALQAAAAHELPGTTVPASGPIRLLREVQHIFFAESVEEEYSIGGVTVVVQRDVALDANRIVVTGARTRQELYSLLAYAIAGLFVSTPSLLRTFANLVTMLLYQSHKHDMASYLNRQGIPWSPRNVSADDMNDSDMEEDEDEQADDNRILGDLLATTFADQIVAKQGSGDLAASITSIETSASPDRLEARTAVQSSTPPKPDTPATSEVDLPPLERVILGSPEPTGQFERISRTGSPGGYPGIGRLATYRPVSEEQRQKLGKRGEQLVFDYEVAQLCKRGKTADEVRWISKDDAYADYDIRSLDENDEEVFLEVKSTVDKHGSFEWSIGEVGKAFKERKRYVLVRVYEVASEHPRQKRFRDPIGLLKNGDMTMDVAHLRAKVEDL